MRTISVIAAPTSTTNMTGFLMIRRGSSFQNESIIACFKILRSVMAVVFAWAVGVIDSSKYLPGVHQQVFKNWAETESGEESQSAYDHDYRDQQNR